MQYQDMDIQAFEAKLTVTPDNQRVGTFKLYVVNCPAGQMSPDDAVSITYDDKQLQRDIAQLDMRALDRAGLIAFGSKLADLLLPPKQADALDGVRELFLKSMALVQTHNSGLRLRLRLPVQLAALPWEYIYVVPPGGGNGIDGFIAINRSIALVRYDNIPAPALSAVTTGNVKVVVALASPSDLPPLDLSKEKADLQLAFSEHSALINAVYLDGATLSAVQQALPTAGVFHFAGHGVFTEQMGATLGTYEGTGSLALNDARIDAEQIGQLLGNSGVRLVVLGACETGRRDGINPWSGIAPALEKRQVPAVVANQFTILDQCAIAFAQQFYTAALIGGLSLEEAVSAGRIAAYEAEPNGREWGVPVLYVRGQDNRLFGGASDDNTRQQASGSASNVIESAPSWDTLVKRSIAGNQSFLSTPAHPGFYVPDLYVPRPDIEQTLHDFLASSANTLILRGDSGMGKTNMLCAWTTALQTAGHVAFLYQCVVFTDPSVDPKVAQDLSPDAPAELANALNRISMLAQDQSKQCVLIFDGISEFRGQNASSLDLLKSISAFVARLPRNIRVVLSLRTSMWNRLDFDTAQSFSSELYFAPAKDQPYLNVSLFSPETLEQAYNHYCQVFQLKTPFADLRIDRQQLRSPLMLRMLAEAYQGEAITDQYLGPSIFTRFYNKHINLQSPQGQQDQNFINMLAAKMLSQGRSSFLLTDLAQDKDIGAAILNTDPNSSYNRLVDYGFLTIVIDERLPGVLGNTLRFSYDQLGGYLLALYLLGQAGVNVVQQITNLVSMLAQFTLAWYTSQTLLIYKKDAGLCATLAQATDLEMRELVVESLIGMHADDPTTAFAIIKQLLQHAVQEVQHTGLKAAYSVNPPARDLLKWAAVQNIPTLAHLTRDALYLIWQTNPDFTYSLLRDLIAEVSIGPTTVPTVEFAFDLLVIIYVSHCEQQYVIDQTSDIFYDLAINKLHLDALSMNFLGPLGLNIEQFLVQTVTPFFTKPLLNSLLFTDLVPADQFFNLPPEQRAPIKQVAPFLDPKTDLASGKGLLMALLTSSVMTFNLIGALVLAIHAYDDFATVKPLMQSLFEELDTQGQGRLWMLLGMSVLLPDTPKAWVELTEEFTRRLITEQPAIFYGDTVSVLKVLDMALLPLGLAYAKQGSGMPAIDSLLQDGLRRGNTRQVVRCIHALGTLGFYYPQAVFNSLGSAIPDVTAVSDDIKSALVDALSFMRVLYFDEVDNFLQQIGGDETFQRNVSVASDIGRVDHLIYSLGFYNNAVHYCLFYPIMRQRLGMSALNILAEESSPDDFISRYTFEAIRLTQDSGFQLRKWVGPAL